MTALMQEREKAPEATVNTLVCSVVSKSVAGGSNVTLSDAECQHAHLILTGALTANINVIVTDDQKSYWVSNETSGSFTVTLKTSAGSGVTITQGKKAYFVCDGTDVEQWSPDH